jgi:hypothetical protein
MTGSSRRPRGLRAFWRGRNRRTITTWSSITSRSACSWHGLGTSRLPCRMAVTCAPHVGPAATVRDGSRSAASAGRSRHGEHPGARVIVAETLIGEACQQPQFAESDVRHSRRMTRNTGAGKRIVAKVETHASRTAETADACLYSSRVQQRARIRADHRGPLRTTGCLLAWAYAGVIVRVPVSGGQGVAGSIPPSRLFFERFFAVYSSSTAVPEEDF